MSNDDDAKRPQYDHRPDAGETRYPPETGKEHPGEPGERDPHEPLNTPLGELEDEAELARIGASSTKPDVQGMGRAQTADNDQQGGDPTLGTRPDRETRNEG